MKTIHIFSGTLENSTEIAAWVEYHARGDFSVSARRVDWTRLGGRVAFVEYTTTVVARDVDASDKDSVRRALAGATWSETRRSPEAA